MPKNSVMTAPGLSLVSVLGASDLLHAWSSGPPDTARRPRVLARGTTWPPWPRLRTPTRRSAACAERTWTRWSLSGFAAAFGNGAEKGITAYWICRMLPGKGPRCGWSQWRSRRCSGLRPFTVWKGGGAAPVAAHPRGGPPGFERYGSRGERLLPVDLVPGYGETRSAIPSPRPGRRARRRSVSHRGLRLLPPPAVRLPPMPSSIGTCARA